MRRSDTDPSPGRIVLLWWRGSSKLRHIFLTLQLSNGLVIAKRDTR